MHDDPDRHIREEAWLLKEKHDGHQSFDYIVDRERLRRGEPLAYIIGWAPFCSTKIWLDSYPLIPRPETEHWVDNAIQHCLKVRGRTPYLRVLDLCAGSGCIGVAVAKAIPEAHVAFAEMDTRHHPTIEKNIETNGIDRGRIRIFGGDLFSDIPTETRYNVILANPPYIDPALDRTDANVRTSEPHTALYGGRGGLEIISRIIRKVPARLRRAGTCYLEHEPEQSAAIADLAATNGLTCSTHNDQYGIQRYSILQHKNVGE